MCKDKLTSKDSDGYKIRRHTVDFDVPLITNIQQAKLLCRCLGTQTNFISVVCDMKSLYLFCGDLINLPVVVFDFEFCV